MSAEKKEEIECHLFRIGDKIRVYTWALLDFARDRLSYEQGMDMFEGVVLELGEAKDLRCQLRVKITMPVSRAFKQSLDKSTTFCLSKLSQTYEVVCFEVCNWKSIEILEKSKLKL